jgi:hypothetical protein
MRFRPALGACFLALAILPARAQAPSTIGHQGVLATSGGAPVADGTYALTFRLYSAATGGTALWTETHPAVSVSSGVFSAALGSITPLNISFEQPLWLSASVNSGAELSPRVQLTAAPYSLTAKSVADNAVTSSKVADGAIATADLADNAVTSAKVQDGAVATADLADNAVTTAKISDGTVTAGDIASGQVVKSVNSLTDAVTLAAGSNVTITPSGNTLTIAASASAGNTLDQAYDQGGAGAGRAITADNGAVDIQGAGGLTVNGNVGIGTTSPGAKLSLTQSGATNADGIRIVNGSVTWNQYTDAAGKLLFASSGGAQVAVQDNGLVGIGTTSPPEKLSIDAGHINVNHSTAPYMRFQRAGAEHGYVGSAGALFVGTQTDFGVRAENNLVFGVSSTERMRLTSAGNVGIGTTSPGGLLHVQDGSVLFAGTTGAIPATGAGTRLMWYPGKKAFRAGVVTGTQWDDANIGLKSTVGGGEDNTASSALTTVGGGSGNTAGGNWATIGGGQNNLASNQYATVGGGGNNTAGGLYATVGGGQSNTAGGDRATVGGGVTNTAWGYAATVGGGENNDAGGDYSFAVGRQAKVDGTHDGAFLFSDGSSNLNFNSAAANEFAARATGGVRFVTAIDGSGSPTAGVQVASGGGSWSSLSDSSLKRNLEPVDVEQIAAKVAALPIATWNYASQADSIRHLGPMAQDFYAAFGVGEDERHIAAVDADGVALAAIQGVYQRVRRQQEQIAALQAENRALKARMEGLAVAVARLERLVAPPQGAEQTAAQKQSAPLPGLLGDMLR